MKPFITKGTEDPKISSYRSGILDILKIFIDGAPIMSQKNDGPLLGQPYYIQVVQGFIWSLYVKKLNFRSASFEEIFRLYLSSRVCYCKKCFFIKET